MKDVRRIHHEQHCIQKGKAEMKIVVFCRTSKSKDIQLSGLLRRNLSGFYRVTMLSSSLMAQSGMGEDLLLLETEKLPEAGLENAVFLFGESFLPAGPLRLHGAPLCIAASDNLPLLKSIAGNGPQVVTCGMSPKDTFSCSGKSEHSAAISLLRQTVSSLGKAVEPLELIFSFSEDISVYNLLAYGALLTLLGNITEPPENPLVIR